MIYKWQKHSIKILISVILLSSTYVLIPFFYFHIPPYTKIKQVKGIEQVAFYYHTSPFYHVNAFAVGMLIGYLIKNNPKNNSFGVFKKAAIWVICIGSTIWAHFWLKDLIKIDVNFEKPLNESIFVHINELSDLESLLYMSLHKIFYIMGFCCVIFMCCTRRASKSSKKSLLDFTNLKFYFYFIDYLNKILSSKWFLPWRRLGMGLYLNQLTVITHRILTFKHNFYINDETIVRIYFQ